MSFSDFVNNDYVKKAQQYFVGLTSQENFTLADLRRALDEPDVQEYLNSIKTRELFGSRPAPAPSIKRDATVLDRALEILRSENAWMTPARICEELGDSSEQYITQKLKEVAMDPENMTPLMMKHQRIHLKGPETPMFRWVEVAK